MEKELIEVLKEQNKLLITICQNLGSIGYQLSFIKKAIEDK